MNIDPTIIVSGIEFIGNVFSSALSKRKPDQKIELSFDDAINIQSQIMKIQRESYSLLTENQNLNEKIKELESQLKEKDDIERHLENYITLKSDPLKIKYCTSCYGKNGMLIQLNDETKKYGTSECPVCKNSIVSNTQVADEFHRQIMEENKRNFFDPYSIP